LSYTALPYLSGEKAREVQKAAKHSVASLRGPVAEALVADLVKQLGHCQNAERSMQELLTEALAELPSSGHSESSLALVGSLLVVTLESPATDVNFGSAEIAGAANTGSFASGPGALGPSLIGQDGNGFGEDTEDPGARPEPPPVAIVAAGAMPWERYVPGIDEALERYNHEHQEKSPETRDNSGDRRPTKDRRDGGSAQEEPAGSPLKEGRFRDGFERREAVDEAIDLFVGMRWRRIEAIEIRNAFTDRDVVATHLAFQREEPIEIKVPGQLSTPSHGPGNSHAPSHRHSYPRDNVSAALILGTVVAGWAHRGWSTPRTLARRGWIARRK
jgi:hypothetical protein